jgi:hypothetical protein
MKRTPRSLLALAPLFVSACVADDAPELAEADQAVVTPAVAPLGTFEIRADRVVYVGFDGAGYRAYELDATFAFLRKSPAVAASQAPAVENLTTDGTYVLFGDGSRNVRLSLAGSAALTFDPLGVFGKLLRGNGGVTLRDGSLARIINGNGFGLATLSPVEAYSGSQPAAVPLLSEGARSYVVPAGYYLRVVDVDTKATTLACKLGASYASTKSLASSMDQVSGTFRIAAKLSDGRLAECKRDALGTRVSTIALPFVVGDLAFEGGGGLGLDPGGGIRPLEFDGGGGLELEGGGGVGIWVTSANTAELAYVFPSGKIVIYPLSGKTSITPIPIPRVVRSFSDGSAAVLMSNGQFVRVARP